MVDGDFRGAWALLIALALAGRNGCGRHSRSARLKTAITTLVEAASSVTMAAVPNRPPTTGLRGG